MSTLQSRVLSGSATLLSVCALLATTVVPASAKPDAGPRADGPAASAHCPLQRVETQFVRCDDLTGNGVPAPEWVPQR